MKFTERMARLRGSTAESEPALDATEDSGDERSLARGGTRGAAAQERLSADDRATEDQLRRQLEEDPNDQRSFEQLVALIRRRAVEEANQTEAAQHSDADPGLTGAIEIDLRRTGLDAVWAVAEELAGNPRAWYPLIELARLSVHEDREAAMRRLGAAADRDASGEALLAGLKMLRREGLPGEALALGTGHWRPKDHSLEVGRHMVESALEAERPSEARRHLDVLASHPDADGAQRLGAEMSRRLAAPQ